MTRPRLLGLGIALLLVVTAGLWWLFSGAGTRITAYFDRAVGLYPGSAVRVLGVKVGTIDRVQPRGGTVQVDMHVDDGTRVPAGAKAVVVAPSLVSDRYVQLTPAYSGGPELASGAVLGRDRTATPAELDDLYRSANALAQALGPDGANRDGALSDVIGSTAGALRGNGKDLNTTIKQLGDLAGTLQDNQGDLFSTVDNLNKFTATLAASDQQIREFSGRVDDVTGFLARDRQDMAAALSSMSVSLDEVSRFIKDNRQLVSSNVHNLTGVTQALVDQRKALSEVLDLAPLGATNFLNAYDAASGTVAVHGQLNELTFPPVLMVCKLVENSTPEPVPQALKDACDKLAPMIDGALKLPSVGETMYYLQQGKAPPLPLPLVEESRKAEGHP
ncbi:MCE family protein [Saccharopolyspora rosea]|uniref:MCE family protein n=1 Tax=Saccharopolyspora rosea TaxID=524884 RepID=UPI0021DA88D4|nr:MCE family protein [Saccharopolyspora rosea]